MSRTIGRLAPLAALVVAAHAPALTVRVASRGGAPCLVVNGRPVRARMFFGGPGSGSIRAERAGRRVSFDFVAENDSDGSGTLHFRFGQAPGDVWLDDIRITDAASREPVAPASDFEGGAESFTRDWLLWPPPDRNTVGTVTVEPGVGEAGSAGLHVKLRQPPDGNWPDFHIHHAANMKIVRGRTYRVSFWVRADPERELRVAFYRPGDPYVYLGGPPGPFETQIKMAAWAGVNFVSFPIGMPWPEPGKPADWKGVDAVCEQVVRANPKALMLPRFGCDPPEWWRKAHPNDTMTWEDGSQQYHGVVASPRYRHDAAERVAALVRHLEARFGENMGGYHPCGQNTGEWFYQDTWEQKLNGYAPADRTAFQAWLRARYKDDAALQAAWHNPSVTLNLADVPIPALRRATPYGTLRDPEAERSLIDFAEFQNDAMAGLVCDLARAVRTASSGRKLVAFFYGYLFEFGPVRLGPSTCGHYALRRALNCPDIDVLCSPISYFDRAVGGSGPSMTAAESVALAGKMWLFEDDTRTYLANDTLSQAKDLAESQAILARNVAQEATRNLATWWMDLGMAGWFNDQRFWNENRQLAAVDRPFLRKPILFRPQVAAVIDERSMLGTSASGWHMTEPGIYKVREPLGRMGAPYGQYLLDDVLSGRVKARLYVFLDAWRLTAAQRKALLRVTRGTVCIWCYAPGLYDGNRASVPAMHELTGFRLAHMMPVKARATPTALGKRLGIRKPLGVDETITPLFSAVDALPEETLATYADGAAAVALRKVGGGWSLFAGLPGLTSELLRAAARKAGVHLYTQTDCNVYANGPIVAVHAAQDGDLPIAIGGNGTVRDALTGALIGRAPVVKVHLKRGETRIMAR